MFSYLNQGSREGIGRPRLAPCRDMSGGRLSGSSSVGTVDLKHVRPLILACSRSRILTRLYHRFHRIYNNLCKFCRKFIVNRRVWRLSSEFKYTAVLIR